MLKCYHSELWDLVKEKRSKITDWERKFLASIEINSPIGSWIFMTEKQKNIYVKIYEKLNPIYYKTK